MPNLSYSNFELWNTETNTGSIHISSISIFSLTWSADMKTATFTATPSSGLVSGKYVIIKSAMSSMVDAAGNRLTDNYGNPIGLYGWLGWSSIITP